MPMTHEQFTAAQTKLLDDNHIPMLMQPGFRSLAWERGHAYGYDEIINELTNILHHLKPGIVDTIEKMYKDSLNIATTSRRLTL